MSATASTIAGQAEDLVSDLTNNPVKRYRENGREIERHSFTLDTAKALAMFQGLASSKRGFSVARIERAG